jgi:hypothetical protein
MKRCGELIYDQRAEEEEFLHTVRDGIANDIVFVERGGVPRNWRGCSKAEILQRLRIHQNNVLRAIEHVRNGGPLADIVPIVWGTK